MWAVCVGAACAYRLAQDHNLEASRTGADSAQAARSAAILVSSWLGVVARKSSAYRRRQALLLEPEAASTSSRVPSNDINNLLDHLRALGCLELERVSDSVGRKAHNSTSSLLTHPLAGGIGGVSAMCAIRASLCLPSIGNVLKGVMVSDMGSPASVSLAKKPWEVRRPSSLSQARANSAALAVLGADLAVRAGCCLAVYLAVSGVSPGDVPVRTMSREPTEPAHQIASVTQSRFRCMSALARGSALLVGSNREDALKGTHAAIWRVFVALQ